MDKENKFYKLWSGDYTANGIDNGIKDRKEGKPNKSTIKFFKIAHPVNLIWHFNKAYDSFVKNYNKGYEQEGLALNNIYGSLQDSEIKKGDKNMSSSINSYQEAISVLRAMKHELEATSGELNVIKNKYKSGIDEAKSRGWMKDYIDMLELKYKLFSVGSEKLKKDINNFVEEIDTDIAKLQNLMQMAKDLH